MREQKSVQNYLWSIPNYLRPIVPLLHTQNRLRINKHSLTFLSISSPTSNLWELGTTSPVAWTLVGNDSRRFASVNSAFSDNFQSFFFLDEEEDTSFKNTRRIWIVIQDKKKVSALY